MDYDVIMRDVLVYIDEHLTDELSVEVIAARAGFSPYHFSRVFAYIVGNSVMEYTRRRRLAFAAAELSTDRKIIDIALDYGFETHSGFSKAFKRRYGASPEVFRAHYTAPRPPLPALEANTKHGGIKVEPIFIQLAALKIAGYVIKTHNVDSEHLNEIPKFWQSIFADGRHKALHEASFLENHYEYCPCFAEDPDGSFEYMIGLKVKDGADVPPEFDVRVIPAANYAVFATPPAESDAAFSKTIQATWDYVMREWFPSSGYEYTAGCVDFEFYGDDAMSDHPVCHLYLPVTKKVTE